VFVGVLVLVGVLVGVIGVGVLVGVLVFVGVGVFVGVCVFVGVFVGVDVANCTVIEPLVVVDGICSPVVVSRSTPDSVTGLVPLATLLNVTLASNPSPFGPLNVPVSTHAYMICAGPITVVLQLMELPVLPRKPPSTMLWSAITAGFQAIWNSYRPRFVTVRARTATTDCARLTVWLAGSM
jgi:hypothetical protein